jgi:hypothetical protein
MSMSTREDWRDLMTPEELATYDAGDYRPEESHRVSRQKKEVEYNPEFMQHQQGCQNFDGTFRQAIVEDETEQALRQPINKMPSDPTQAKLLAEAIPALADVSAACFVCDETLRDGRQDRVTLIIHATGKDETATYCKTCFDEKNVLPLRPVDDWHSKVSARHLEIAERRAQGETFAEIGEAMNVHPRKVSRMFAEVKVARKVAGNRQTQ